MKKILINLLVMALLVGGGLYGYAALRPAATDTYTLTADVEQGPNLFEGGRVMVRGVEVGEITLVEPRETGVYVEMEIDSSVKIPAGATLSVIPITVISDRYVQLFPAYSGGPALKDGSHIPVERTAVPAELDDVLTQLKGLLAALEPKPGERRGPLARLVVNLDKVFDGNADELSGALDGSAAVFENLADSKENITGLIQNLDTLFVTLANRASELAIVNERFQSVAEALLADQEDLEGTTENLALLSTQATGLISESGDELGESFGRLAKVLDSVLSKQEQLEEGIRWSNVITQALGATDKNGKGLNAYSGKQAPVATEGAEYNYRLDTRDTIACERIGALVESFKVLNPAISAAQVRESIFRFIPDTYEDDLGFLLDILIPVCSVLPGETPAASALSAETQESLRAVAARVGEERFQEMVTAWMLAGTFQAVKP